MADKANIHMSRCPSARSQGVRALARNTVKKYLRTDATEPHYVRRVSSSNLNPCVEKLATWQGMEATKSRKTAAHFKADPHSLRQE